MKIDRKKIEDILERNVEQIITKEELERKLLSINKIKLFLNEKNY